MNTHHEYYPSCSIKRLVIKGLYTQPVIRNSFLHATMLLRFCFVLRMGL